MRRCDGRRVRRPNPAALPRQSLLSITHRHHRLLIHRPSLLHVRETRLDDQVSSGFALSDLFSSTSVALGVGMFSPCRRSSRTLFCLPHISTRRPFASRLATNTNGQASCHRANRFLRVRNVCSRPRARFDVIAYHALD